MSMTESEVVRMTENEAVEMFRKLLDVPCEMIVKYDSVLTKDKYRELVKIRCAEEMAISALEEVQQYRAIGTVEELKSMKENGAFSALEMVQIVAKLNKLKEYEDIGTVSEFRELKEKATAKKPIPVDSGVYDYDFDFVCPNCGENVDDIYNYCDCGQHLDWSEGKE